MLNNHHKMLNELIQVKNIKHNNFTPLRNIYEALSSNSLETIKAKGDLPKARLLEDNDNRIHLFKFDMRKFEQVISDLFECHLCNSGYYWYPYGGFCGWHTNSDCAGKRIYLVWAQEDKKSFFRYRDPEHGKIITSWDKQGWQIKKFKPSNSNLLWHCVGSHTNRFSIGFKPVPT